MSRAGTARHNARRDSNERTLIDAFKAAGCLVWQLSGKGLPDLLVMKRGRNMAGIVGQTFYWLIDVKTPTGGFKPAQVEKWGEALDAGIPIFVCRTPEDVRAVLAGSATPWGRMDAAPVRKPKAHRPGVDKATSISNICAAEWCVKSRAPRSPYCKAHQPKRKSQRAETPGSDRVKACGCKRSLGRCEHSGQYSPGAVQDDGPQRCPDGFKDCYGDEDCIHPPRSKGLDAPALAAETFAPCSCTREQPCAACSRVG